MSTETRVRPAPEEAKAIAMITKEGHTLQLNDDKKLLVSAAGRAQKAADYVLGITPDTEGAS